ncbi:hypothetical protein [Miniphocaeibacter halophilus]|uniref:Uncharacterized protein n=1 Tax=Miniphocaeibacter halophilus TaxID=2931922 RepID=A0AC61N6V1_9FIRM|nr:hypothetical protein [Miniphocaeibacter halophilus]QQK08153.1 hypothetical protein JFY71_01055 [Miniphocaeibacter halophilus]
MIIEILIILTAVILHQVKGDKDLKTAAGSGSFYISLLFFLVIGLVNLIIGKGLPVELSHLDMASILSVIYLGILVFLKSKSNSKVKK